MPEVKRLKPGEVADPFNTRVSGKDQARVPQGTMHPAGAAFDGEEGESKSRRRAIHMPTTRLAQY